MAAGGKTLLVDLGDQMQVVEERVKDGSYASADEVIRAALRDFDRGRIEDDAWLMELVGDALADPKPDIPAAEVFAELEAMFRAGEAGG